MKLIKNKEWYMQKIVKFTLNMTAYEGDWRHGYHHQYDIHIQDVIPNFVIFTLISDNGALKFDGWDLLSGKRIEIDADAHLTRKTARKIYQILKRINIFK